VDINIREAELDDAPLIAALTRSAWAKRVAESSTGHHESADGVADNLREGGGFILSVEGMPVGSVRWLPLEASSDIWEISRMGVLPGQRGHRLSQHLLEAVIHHALASDVDELRLAVRIDQPRLLDLYATFGFELAPELEYSHANPLEPAPTVMRRVLRR
jgi:ribosomal protein S18 acetylase RimI-like enzyme